MAQNFVTTDGSLIIPGAYPSVKAQTGVSGVASNGILMLVGEADAGPDFTKETDINLNQFGPDQLADVVAKYKSGPLVDAFRTGAVPANDPNILGQPSRFMLVKTNPSTKASSALLKVGGGTWGSLVDKSSGKLGNLIYYTVTSKTAEVVPTTGSFAVLVPGVSYTMDARVNGSAATALTVTAGTLPPAFASQVAAVSGIGATGGTDRTTIQAGLVGTNITLAVVSGNAVTITLASGSWSVTPTVGDTLYIPTGSCIVGAGNANRGSYIVTAATASVISATKLLDYSGVLGQLTAPLAAGPAAIAGASADVNCYAPVVVSTDAGAVIPGIGKSIELAETTGGTERLSNFAWVLSGTTPVKASWVSTATVPVAIVSSAEQAVNLNVNRQLDSIQEILSAGGDVVLRMGYSGTSATVTITATTLSTTVAGGSGGNLSLTLKDYPTVADLVAYINAQTGYNALVGTATLGNMLSTALDEVVAQGICTTNAAPVGRIKTDAVKLFNAIKNQSVLVQLNDPEAVAACGLPALVSATTFLSGGTRGATTDTVFNLAVDALELAHGNFLVPLFSRDATADIADGLTDSGSTYTIDSINAYCRTHVLAMSALKRRRPRQAFCSKRTDFTSARQAAGNMASHRVSLAFQDVKNVGQNGLAQFQPWEGAVLAAGMQAAGFYRAIVRKFPNCTGALMADGSFKDQKDSNVEDALTSGLLPLRADSSGAFYWASDQTTYSKDDNFYANSIQAVYVGDLIGSTIAQKMEIAFVGQSVADVSAGVAMSVLQAIMRELVRLKLIAPSDDAPAGYKNASIRISGPSMVVSLEAKLAGAIYFIPVSVLVSPVQQTA